MPEDLFTTLSDASVYFVLGALGTLLMVIRIVLMLVLGIDSDVDIDVHGDVGDVDGGGDFSVLSIFSVLAFFAGFGWAGYGARIEWGWGSAAAALFAFAIGFVMMLTAASMMFYIRKLNATGAYDLRTAVGKTGRAYRTIPANGAGRGEIQITVSGAQRVLPARTHGQSIESFTSVRVVEVEDDGTLIVERIA